MSRIAVVSLIVLAALVVVACAPIQAPESAQMDTPTSVPSESVPIKRASDVPRVTVEEAKAHFDNDTAVFVDSRSRDSYDVEHITGAIPRPEGAQPSLDTSIPKDQLIISYCT